MGKPHNLKQKVLPGRMELVFQKNKLVPSYNLLLPQCNKKQEITSNSLGLMELSV